MFTATDYTDFRILILLGITRIFFTVFDKEPIVFLRSHYNQTSILQIGRENYCEQMEN